MHRRTKNSVSDVVFFLLLMGGAVLLFVAGSHLEISPFGEKEGSLNHYTVTYNTDNTAVIEFESTEPYDFSRDLGAAIRQIEKDRDVLCLESGQKIKVILKGEKGTN